MKMVKVGEIKQIKNYKCVNEEGNTVGREVEVKSPLYINPDNVVWMEPSVKLGTTIFFNTDKGSVGTASVTVGDVLVEDMLRIIEGEASYEDVRIENFEKRCEVMKSKGLTTVLREISIPVME